MQYSLLILDLVPLADKALLMFLSHVLVKFVLAEETFATKLAEGMDTALNFVSVSRRAIPSL